MGQIIELPEIKKLKQEIRELKKSLEDFVLERDELKLVICENIKTAYMLHFGGIEYRVYKAYCEFLRLRRKKEMIQAKKNRQERISMDAIENCLDIEFFEYQEKLNHKITEMNRAMERSKMEMLSDEETEEIKKLYRSIVKSLHPDINPATSDAEKELFYHAAQAYEQGDISALQVILQIAGTEENKDLASSSLITLRKEKQRLTNLVDRIQADIERIKENPPYTWRMYVEDEKKKAERLDDLRKELFSFQNAIRTQEEQIYEVMGHEI